VKIKTRGRKKTKLELLQQMKSNAAKLLREAKADNEAARKKGKQ